MVARKLNVKIPGRTEYLGLIRKIVTEISRNVGFPQDKVDEIEISVDEALSNIIRYSHLQPKDIHFRTGPILRRETDIEDGIDLNIHIDSDKILLNIIDYGRGYDFAPAPGDDIERYLKELNFGQLSIFIIRTFMDEVTYHHCSKRGNYLTLIKYFADMKNGE